MPSPSLIKAFSGDCFYCKSGFTSRCERGLLFGSRLLDGGQAEYVRVPLADGTIFKAPDTELTEPWFSWPTYFPPGISASRMR